MGTLETQLSLCVPLMTRPALYNNLVLKKPWLLETPPPPPPPPPPTTTTLLLFFLSRAERIRPGDTAEPFDSDWPSKCLHFHLLIHCLVASLWPPPWFLFFFSLLFWLDLNLKRKCSINAYVFTFHINGLAPDFQPKSRVARVSS